MIGTTEICARCGKANNLHHLGSDYHSSEWCFGCNHWHGVAVKPGRIVIDGWVYFDGGRTSVPSNHNGFGGREFVIEMVDGPSINTNNLFSAGAIPEVWRSDFPDNAVFAPGNKKQWIDIGGTLCLASVTEA